MFLFSFSAGARPKVRPKVKHGVDNEGILTIELEGSTEPLLQVKLKGKILKWSSI